MDQFATKIDVEFGPHAPADQAVGTAFAVCFDNVALAAANFSPADDGALHRLRVTLRRARAALSFVARLSGDPEVAALRAELRWIGRELGPARDLDVLVADALTGPDETPGLASLRQAAEARRLSAHAAAAAALASARFESLIRRAAVWRENRRADAIETGEDEAASLAVFAAGLLRRRWKKLKRDGAAALRGDAEARHALRIRCKKLQIAIDLFGDVFAGRRARRRRKDMVAALKKVQVRLGWLNDIESRRTLLSDLALSGDTAGAFAGGVIVGREELRRTKELRVARRAFTALKETKSFWK